MPTYKQTLAALIESFAQAAQTKNAILIDLSRKALEGHLALLPDNFTPPEKLSPPDHELNPDHTGTGSTSDVGSGEA